MQAPTCSGSLARMPDFSIGSAVWPGLAKLIEECGELLQVAGKVIAYPAGEHPDGSDIVARLNEEIADVAAAIKFVVQENSSINATNFRDRRDMKVDRFQRWHREARR